MLKVMYRTGRVAMQGVFIKHSMAPRPAGITQIYRYCAEKSLIPKPEQTLAVEKDSADTEEARRKFNRRAIFDLCLEKFDDDLLYFHEAVTREEWESLIDYGRILEEYMNIMNYDEICKTGKINQEIKEMLGKLNVFNIRIPKAYGGKEFNETQSQYIHEILAIRPSVARWSAENEEMGVRVLVKYGTEAQKAKYLPKLATGEMTVAFAFLEESSSTLDPNSYIGVDVIQENGKFILNGEKTWVYNAKSADVFIVIGTQTILDKEGILRVTSLFIVDKNNDCMIVHNPIEKKWFRGVDISQVIFNDVTIGTDCVLGQYGKGYEIFMDIFQNNKTSILAECSSIIKRLVFDASDKCDHLKIYNLPFNYGDFGMGELSVLAYATESLTYYLAGRADYFKHPDLAVEIALAKIFAMDTLQEAIQMYFSFVGRFSYDKNKILEEIVQNSPYYSILDDSTFDMKIYIMSQVIKYLVAQRQTKYKQIREPFSFPLISAKFLLSVKKNEMDAVKPKLQLRQCVSGGVSFIADELEYCINRFAYCCERHILKYMKHSMENDYDLLILCDILFNIYALIACLARASRAYYLKTQNYQRDVELAYSFAMRTTGKVKHLSSLLCRNQEELECCAEIGRKALTNKNYTAEHPLTRNF